MSSHDATRGKRLLFASYHSCIDPSSGAAVSVRELLRQLSASGWGVRTCCGPQLDFDRGEDVRQILADEQIVFQETAMAAQGCSFSLLSFHDGAVRSSVLVPEGPAKNRLTEEADRTFLAGYRQAIAEWRPDVLLTYGGNWAAEAMFLETRRLGIPVVFWLHNFAYNDARLFKTVDRVIVPSKCSATHYRETLGLDCHVLPCAFDWERVTCEPTGDRYVTFVNPQPHKGVFVFARIAEQLHRLRPDIPLLIVEGRSGVEWLEKTELDLSGLTNLNVMQNTPDVRDFYRVSRIVLMPSLWRESFGRVAAEAMINGIPVVASNRGALPEVLDGAGFLVDVPEGYTPESREVPTAEEVVPWVETIVRLWDDGQFYDETSRRCRERAEAWRPGVLLPRYEEILRGTMR